MNGFPSPGGGGVPPSGGGEGCSPPVTQPGPPVFGDVSPAALECWDPVTGRASEDLMA